ncbi:MAG: LemA family protein [Alphaproteobacteria bacterium]
MEWLIVLAVVAVVGGYVIAIYNRLVSLSRRVDEAWSDIQVQMKRRYDLIPNLVETVKGYMAHERGTLDSVTQARAAAVAAGGGPAEQARAENMLQGALRSLFAVAENYPDLKANQSFLTLQRDIADTENRLESSRRFYNGNVRALNVTVEQFPSNLVAKQFGFGTAQFFELDTPDAAQPVRVAFS